jgi:hypothetical protein
MRHATARGRTAEREEDAENKRNKRTKKQKGAKTTEKENKTTNAAMGWSGVEWSGGGAPTETTGKGARERASKETGGRMTKQSWTTMGRERNKNTKRNKSEKGVGRGEKADKVDKQ